jgi:hypothetical protein
LTEQFRLSVRVSEETSRAHRAILQIRSLKEQLSLRAKSADDAETSQLAGAITSKFTGVEEDLYQVKNRSPRDTLNYPIKLNNQLAALQNMIDMGDSKPTEQDYAVYEELKAHLNQILRAFPIGCFLERTLFIAKQSRKQCAQSFHHHRSRLRWLPRD